MPESCTISWKNRFSLAPRMSATQAARRLPSRGRFCPCEDLVGPGRVGCDHGRDERVHKRVVIRPTGDAVEPRREQLEFLVSEKLSLVFEQKDCEHFFFKILAGIELVGHAHNEFHSLFLNHLAPGKSCYSAQVGGVPAVRLYFFLEEPLNALCMGSGSATL